MLQNRLRTIVITFLCLSFASAVVGACHKKKASTAAPSNFQPEVELAPIAKRVLILSSDAARIANAVQHAYDYLSHVKTECEYIAWDDETTNNASRGSTIRGYLASAISEVRTFASETYRVSTELSSLSNAIWSLENVSGIQNEPTVLNRLKSVRSTFDASSSAWADFWTKASAIESSLSQAQTSSWQVDVDNEGVTISAYGTKCKDSSAAFMTSIQNWTSKVNSDASSFYQLSHSLQ